MCVFYFKILQCHVVKYIQLYRLYIFHTCYLKISNLLTLSDRLVGDNACCICQPEHTHVHRGVGAWGKGDICPHLSLFFIVLALYSNARRIDMSFILTHSPYCELATLCSYTLMVWSKKHTFCSNWFHKTGACTYDLSQSERAR